jgi:hypothetical protein
MITKEELKNEVDKLPDNLLEEVHELLKRAMLQKKEKKPHVLSIRNFYGKLDAANVRSIAYE